MFNLFSTETNAYKSLGGKEFKDDYTKSKQPVLLDVRTAAEFSAGSLKDAQNIDVMSQEFQKQVSALDKGKDYFVFCRSGNRSGQACRIMAEEGFNVFNLKGGVANWPR